MKKASPLLLSLGLILAIASEGPAQVVYSYTTIDFPGAISSYAEGINAAGQIVGYYGGSGGTSGFLRDGAGNYTTINIPGSNYTQANGINAGGQIVGYYENAGDTVGHSFLRSAAGGLTTIDVPGALFTSANAVNSGGQVAGYYADSNNFGHGFVRSPSGDFTTVNVPGATFTFIAGINDNGQLVGTYADASMHSHGFLLAGSTLTTIDLPSVLNTQASGINSLGQVVGSGGTTGGPGFLWTAGTFSFFAVPGESVGDFAQGINDAGQVVGIYTSSDLHDHGFLATPVPEPTSLAFCACGVAGWFLRRRRTARVSAAGLSFAIIALTLVAPAAATAQTWTGAVNGNWSNPGNWSPAGMPVSNDNLQLIFGAAGTTAMTDDINTTFFHLNRLTFQAGGPTYSLASIGNFLDFRTSSVGAAPQIVLDTDAAITLGIQCQLTNNLTITGAGAGTLVVNRPVGGSGSLTMSAAGTLLVNSSTSGNGWTGGTFVTAGTLRLGAGGGLPSFQPLTVTGGVFDTGGNNVSMGTLTIGGAGSVRATSGAATLVVQQLAMTGGTVDLTGSSGILAISNPAGIVTNRSMTTALLIGGATSRIVNNTSAAMPINVADGTTPSGIDLDVSLPLSRSGSNPSFVKAGPGVMRLTSTASTADLKVSEGTLRVDDMAALGSGALTLSAATLQYGGATSTTLSKTITVTDYAILQNLTPGTVWTIPTTLSGSAVSPFFVGTNSGAPGGVVSLTGTNTYTGPTYIFRGGIVSVPTVTNGGVAGPLGAGTATDGGLRIGEFGTRGTLRLTGTSATYSTDRNIALSGYVGAVTAFDVVNPTTALTLSGQITGSGALTKQGPGTLILTNTTNNYAGGTIVEGGRLLLTRTAGSAVMSPITVLGGAVFDAADYFNFFDSAFGTISLAGGTFRASDSSGDQGFQLNRLEMIGGTVDFSASLSTQLFFVKADAGIRSFASSTTSTLIGQANSSLIHSLTTPFSIDVDLGATATGIDLDVGLKLLDYGNYHQPFLKAGLGTMRLTNLGSTADVVVAKGRLRIDDVTSNGGLGAFGTGQFTLDGGTFQYAQGTATAVKSLIMGPGGGCIEVTDPATTLTYSGLLTGQGTFTKSGSGVLVLTNPGNAYLSGTVVAAGRLEIADDAALGSALGSVAITGAGTLRYTSTSTSGRSFNLNFGSLEAPTGVTLTLNGANVNGGFLRGAGTYALTGGVNLSGTSTATSTTINQTGPASVTNFTNNGQFTVSAGQTLSVSNATNTSAGRMTINGTANVSDFVSNGYLNVPVGGIVNNSGSVSPMVLGGGSTTFVGSVANPGGKVDLGGQQLIVRGGLLVTNAGSFASGNGVRNGTTVADFGALVKGTGPYQSVITQNGGQYLPGNSPGTSQVGTFAINGGGSLIFEITDAGPSSSFPSAPGTAGNNPGWGLTHVFTSLEFTATPSNKFNIDMRTQLAPPAAPNTPGPMASFDPSRAYSWLVFDLQPGAVFNGAFNPAAINFITTQFANPTAGGQFSLSRTGGQVFLTFTPVPEPATIFGASFLALFGGWGIQRRRREPRTV